MALKTTICEQMFLLGYPLCLATLFGVQKNSLVGLTFNPTRAAHYSCKESSLPAAARDSARSHKDLATDRLLTKDVGTKPRNPGQTIER